MMTQHKGFGGILARLGGMLLLGLLAGLPSAKAQAQCVVLPQAFFTGEQSVGDCWYWLSFNQSSGQVPFGYYTYTSAGWMDHLDLGWEYVFDANSPSCVGCVYFYDNTSGHYFFTSPSLFPYLYDYTLNVWLWYVPDVTQPGNYTANPRFFVNLTTDQVISLGSASSSPNYSLPQVPVNALAINGTVVGASTVGLPMGDPQTFTFTYTDPLGSSEIAWGQDMQLDSSLGPHCYLSWGPNSVDLYDGTPPPPGTMSDAFCSVSPASVLYSASAQVTIPFTFFQASPNAYSVITQVYDTSGNYGPWVQVGSVTVTGGQASVTSPPAYQPPPASAPMPTPPAPISNSGTNCGDISGTWVDSYNSAWTYSFDTSGGALTSDSSAMYTDSCGRITWQAAGSLQPDGTWQITLSNGSTNACGKYGELTVATVTAQCGAATVVGSSPGSPPGTRALAMSTSPGTTTWTRSSDPPGITVTVDIMAGKVNTQLTGQKTSVLTIAIENSQGQQVLSTPHASAQAGNSFSDSFRTLLNVGQYGSVTATWDTSSVTVPASFYMIGLTHVTQYNTPYHSQCSSNQQPALIIDKMDSQLCYYQDVMLGADFLAAAGSNRNGTGVYDANGTNTVLKTYYAGAMNICPLYPGFDAAHTFFSVDMGGNPITKINGTNYQVVLSDGTGPGSGSALNNYNPPPGSLATDPNVTNAGSPPVYIWSDAILVVDQSDSNDSRGLRSVQDICPACAGQGTQTSASHAHIDMYNGTSQSCSAGAVGDYGSGQWYAIRLR